MSTRTTLTTTTWATAATSPTITTGLTQDQKLGLEVLSLTESMNNQVLTEIGEGMKSSKVMMANLQKTLEITIQENGLLKKEIVQLNTIINEKETLHAAEMKNNTQTIETLSAAVTQLTENFRLMTTAVDQQRKDFESLATCYNAHTDSISYFRASSMGGMVTVHSSGPSTPYVPPKK